MSSAVERGEITLEEMKNQRSTTPPEDRERCPECLSVKIEEKQMSGKDMPNRKRGRYRCQANGCRNHFDEPVSGISPNEGGPG